MMSNKKQYNITIEEVISDDFVVYADSREEALQIAKRKYSEGEFVLAPGNLLSKKMGILSETNDMEWTDF